jgi:hypothetical protein
MNRTGLAWIYQEILKNPILGMPENIYHIAEYHTYMLNGPERKCALCEETLPSGNAINICESCLKNADCCVGLENLRE